MVRKTYRCTYCEKEFKSGDWTGCTGDPFRRHSLPSKTYYSTHGNYQVGVIKERPVLDAQGVMTKLPSQMAKFTNGVFGTDDPQFQEELDRLTEEGALCSQEEHAKSKMTGDQLLRRSEGQVTEQNKLIAQQSEELARLRSQIGKTAEKRPSA